MFDPWFRDCAPIMENQLEKDMKNDMDIGSMEWFIALCTGLKTDSMLRSISNALY